MSEQAGKSSRSPISIDDATQIVGRAIYGDKWIVALDVREQWVCEKYAARQSSIAPGDITYILGAGDTTKFQRTGEPRLDAEIACAIDRRAWMEAQYDRVFELLDREGFDLDAEAFDTERFKRLLSKICAPLPKTAPILPDDEVAAKTALAPSRDPLPSAELDPLAEWIFAQHPRRMTFEALYNEARGASALGTFRMAEFLTAFARVYETQAHRPPATGWPFRGPYKDRVVSLK